MDLGVRFKTLISDVRLRCVLLYTFTCGIFAHGMILFNLYIWHDGMQFGFQLNFDTALSLGRWLRALSAAAVKKLFGGQNIGLPLFYGVLSFVLIAASAYLIICLLDIRLKTLQYALCGILVAFPVVACTFGYMFTAPYYFLSLFLAVLAVWLNAEKTGVIRFILGTACLCCSMGLYQGYSAVTVSLFLIMLIFRSARDRYEKPKAFILHGCYSLGIIIAGAATYFGIWRIMLKIFHVEVGRYQGMSTMGKVSDWSFGKGILDSYKAFFLIFEEKKESVYVNGIAWFQWALIAVFFVLVGLITVKVFRKNKLQGILTLILCLLLPMAFNFAYVITSISAYSFVHAVMLYGQVMFYVFLIAMLQLVRDSERKPAPHFFRVAAVLLFGILLMDIHLDNYCYLKVGVEQQQAINEVNGFVSRIKSTPGYHEGMPVVVVYSGKEDTTLAKNEMFSDIKLVPFSVADPLHTERNLKNYMKIWCGFEPPEYNRAWKMKEMDAVKNMPCYPYDGCTQVINGILVAKW